VCSLAYRAGFNKKLEGAVISLSVSVGLVWPFRPGLQERPALLPCATAITKQTTSSSAHAPASSPSAWTCSTVQEVCQWLLRRVQEPCVLARARAIAGLLQRRRICLLPSSQQGQGSVCEPRDSRCTGALHGNHRQLVSGVAVRQRGVGLGITSQAWRDAAPAHTAPRVADSQQQQRACSQRRPGRPI
jgi:hypothetical protein